MSMNDAIWSDPDKFPAVTEVNREVLEFVAAQAHRDLRDTRMAYAILQPDDGTRYEISIVEAPALMTEGPYVFSSNHGPMNRWLGGYSMDPEYAGQKYVTGKWPWTATVFALFLNSVGELLHETASENAATTKS